VDIGVHQDGLVHISALSDKFVKDPREVVKAGDVVKVKVKEVDVKRRRVGLTMRLSDDPRQAAAQESGMGRGPAPNAKLKSIQPAASSMGAMAEAFAKLKKS
ncbi:MAG TPA: S1 RNA-binding domain-containing protein, partial [Gammaproteobacteria bacterium]